MTTKSRMIRVLAMTAATAAVASVALTIGPAAALPPGTPPTTGQNLTVPAGATSASLYQMTLSTGNNFCPGDGLAGFRWATYMVPASVDAGTLTWTAAGPSAGAGVFAQPLFSSSGSPQVAKTPGIGDGLISGIPANFRMADIAALPVPNGEYKVGFACYKAGVTERYWQSTITVSGSSASDFNWVKGVKPAAPVLASPLTVDNQTINGSFSETAGDPAISSRSITAVPRLGGTTVTKSVGAAGAFTLGAADGVVNGKVYDVKVTVTNSIGSTDSNTVTSPTVAPPACGQAQGFVWTKKASAADLSWSAPTQASTPAGAACAAALTGYTLTVADGVTPITGSPFTQTGTTKALTGLDSSKSYNVTLTANYSSPYVTGAALTSSNNTVLPDAYLTQTISATRPVGALVMTQRCGVHGPLNAVTNDPYFGTLPAVVNTNTGPETQARDWLPTGTTWTPGIGGITGETGSVSGGTLPTNNSADPTRPLSSYPYPTDASGVPNANYPTDCGINLGIGKLITTGPKAGQYFTAQGWINQITVVETRDDDAGWTINGQMGKFVSGSNEFHGNLMGWNPQVNGTSDATLDGYDQIVTAGAAKDPVAESNANGLAKDKKGTLASAAATKGLGIATLDARLRLLIPLTAKAGTFTGTMTFTSI